MILGNAAKYSVQDPKSILRIEIIQYKDFIPELSFSSFSETNNPQYVLNWYTISNGSVTHHENWWERFSLSSYYKWQTGGAGEIMVMHGKTKYIIILSLCFISCMLTGCATIVAFEP